MKSTFSFSLLAILAFVPRLGFAQLYYDTNGATPGTSTSSTQNFTDAVWTLDSTGSTTTTGYTAGSAVIFSAGTNGSGAQNVTVTDTESANSFTFNNGTVTLLGSGSPNLSIGAGGVIVNSTDGVTTFDSTLGTVTLSASQSWNNKTSLAFNVNSGVTGSGQTLSFGGTGVASNVGISSTSLNGVNLNGQVTGNVNLTQNSAGSPLMLNNTNNTFTGNITANGGVIVGQTPGSFGNGSNTIFLNNGGTIGFAQDSFSGVGFIGNNIVLGTGGGQLDAGVPGVSGTDIVLNGTISGGTGLTVLGGDFLPNSGSGAGDNVGTLNVVGGRLLAFQNGIFDNNAVVNVSSGAVLDFNQGGTLTNTINLADGSALENRSGGIAFTNVVMPTGTATVTLGADDVGGGSISINSGITLTGTLTLDINENHVSNPFNADTSVALNGKITGSGGLNLTLIPGVFNEGTVALNGNNDYSGPTTLTGVTVVTPDNTVSGNKAFGSSVVTMNSANLELSGGNLSNHVILGPGNDTINLQAGAGPQTISGLIEATPTSQVLFVTNNSTSNLTIGDYTADTNTAGGSAILADQFNSTGSITFDGTYNSTTGTGGAAQIDIGFRGGSASANYYVGPSANFSNYQTFNYTGPAAIDLGAGNLYLQNSSFVPGQFLAMTGSPDVNQTFQIVGSQNIKAILYDSMKNGGTKATDGVSLYGRGVINQSTANQSTWSGALLQDGTNLTLSAVSGGRLVVTGDLQGSTPQGLIIAGNGVVVLANAGGNSYNELDGNANLQPSTNVAATLKTGSTTLIENQGGSAFGTSSSPNVDDHGNAFYNNPGAHNFSVNVEAGATLGGNGNSHQKIVAEDASSVIAPGDAGQANLGIAPSIGTLTLAGGLSAVNGLTMDFKLDGDASNPGTNNDDISLSDFALGGTVTVNFTNLGTVDTSTAYQLIFGSGNWTQAADTKFVINAPAGYELDPNWTSPDGRDPNGIDPNTGLEEKGYNFDIGADSFTVKFIATPEPSTYGLMGLGLLALVAIRRWRKLRA